MHWRSSYYFVSKAIIQFNNLIPYQFNRSTGNKIKKFQASAPFSYQVHLLN